MTDYTLTLEDINSSENLRRLGAKSGDKIGEDKSLIRVFSRPEDEVDHILTAEDVFNSENLQKLEAKEGDSISNGKLIRGAENDIFTSWAYGQAKGESTGLVDYGIDYLISHFPTAGHIIDFGLDYLSDNIFSNPFDSWDERQKYTSLSSYKSADEKYGKGFTKAEPQERREMILRSKERELQENFKGYRPDGGFMETAGEIYGTLKDPSTLFPMGKGVANVAVRSGILGGGFSATQDLATKGEVDPVKAGLFTAASAAAPLALVGAVKATPIVASKVSSLYTNKSSSKTVKKAQALIAQKQSKGINVTEQDLPNIAEELGISPARLEASFRAQKVQPRFYSSVDDAERAVQAAIAEDSAVFRTVSKGADRFLGILSTRIKEIDDGVFGRLMRTEFNLHKRTQDYLKRADNFVAEVGKLPEMAKQELNYYIGTGRFNEAESWMQTNAPQLLRTTTKEGVEVNPFEDVKELLFDLGEELTEAGHKADVENYFPRSVKNYGQLEKALGREQQDLFTKELIKTAERKKKDISQLTSDERDRAIERVLKSKDAKTVSERIPGQTQPRTLDDEISIELMSHYNSPGAALQKYIRSSVNHIERKKFFGKGEFAVENIGDESGINLDASIQSMVDDLVTKGKIDDRQAVDLRDMLSSRFGSADTPMHGTLAGIKNLGYIGTLGDFMSTLTQAADVPNVIGYHGFKNTVKAAIGKKSVVMDDVGLNNQIAQELHTEGRFSKTLDKLLGATQFKRLDRFGKESLMNAVKNKYVKQLNPANEEGVAKFKQKWGDVYGPDIDKLVSDLQAGRKTELTNLHFFTKLSEHQPVSYSEYPQAYLNSPNGRVLYMLKSFTLKQYDLVRRNVVHEAMSSSNTKSGKRKAADAAWKLGKIGSFMAAGGLGVEKTKDFLLGRDIAPEDLPTDALWALAGAFGLNKYGSKNIKEGNLTGFADNLLTVPIPVFEGIESLLSGDFEKSMKHVPIAGRLLESHLGGGKERYNKKKLKERYE